VTRSAAPLVLQWPVVAVTRPQPPPVSVTARTPAVVTVAWPRVRVGSNVTGPVVGFIKSGFGDRPPPAPAVIRPAARPQGPWRLPLPRALSDMLAHPLPARVVG
jgi:hypothetical protein